MAKEVTTGEIDWNAADLPGSKGKTDFIKLAVGATDIRVLSNPHQYHTHWILTPDGKKRKITSPTSNPDLVRRIEAAGFKQQPSWILRVLDRNDGPDGKFKLWEIGPQIYKALMTLVNNPKWGKLPAYDVTVTRGPEGQNPLYNVTPNPKEALDSSMKAKFAEFNDSVDLSKFTAEMPSAEIEKLLGFGPTESTGNSKAKTKSMDYDFE